MNEYLKYRQQAAVMVDPFVRKHNQYRCLTLIDAYTLLGEIYFEKMMSNPIKRLGPTQATIYPWNVIDYLSMRLQCEDQEKVS